MEDHPAGAACPEPRGQWRMSVVVPVRNGGNAFQSCLRALRESFSPPFELIVVDDASQDDSAKEAAAAGAIVIRHDRPRGPAAARNEGARLASAPLVFFLDADVSIAPDTLQKILDCFDKDSELSALFGSYNDCPTEQGLVSQFRNLLHHYVHQSGSFHEHVRIAHTFWTGCGAIRRDRFLELGGFDPKLYRRPAIEDIEFGYRLTRAGDRILLARDIQVTHHKRWTLGDMVRTDIFRRGVPWLILMARSGVAESDLNVSQSQRLSVAATALLLFGIALALLQPNMLAIAALALLWILVLNRNFYRFLHARIGLLATLGCVPLHCLYFFCCGCSVFFAGCLWLCRPSIRLPIVDRLPLGRRRDSANTIPRHHLPHDTTGSRQQWSSRTKTRS